MENSSDGAVWAVILAAGRGDRFGGGKQFQLLHGRRLVDRVVETAASVCDAVVVVLPRGADWTGPPVAATVTGAVTRSASVRAGLTAVPGDAAQVVIHDAAHPLAGPDLFRAVIEAVRDGADAALPALPLDDPVKWVERERVIRTVPPEGAVLVQTPHAFRADVLRAAHADAPEVREDTELIERRGGDIRVVPGDPRNLHVTTPQSLELIARISAAELA